MSLQQTIAHYRIASKLGQGGMGMVYRATDTKLGREVAIKALPERFAGDSSRLARFAREAKVLASLNTILAVILLAHAVVGFLYFRRRSSKS